MPYYINLTNLNTTLLALVYVLLHIISNLSSLLSALVVSLVLAVLSLAGLIAPGEIDSDAANRDAPYMLGVTVLLFILCFTRRAGSFRITRVKGMLLIGAFVAYQLLLFSQLKQ